MQAAGGADRVKAYLTCVWKGNLDQSHIAHEEQARTAVKLEQTGFKGVKIRAWRPKLTLGPRRSRQTAGGFAKLNRIGRPLSQTYLASHAVRGTLSAGAVVAP